MTEYLQILKSDLLSRRLLPFVVLLAVVLVVAVGYAAMGGAGNPAPTTAGGPAGAPASVGAIAVAAAPASPTEAVSETPAGARYQSQGPTRDPFTPLPAPPAAKQASGAGSSSAHGSTPATGTGGSSTTSPGGSGGSGAPTPTPVKPSSPVKPRTVHVVSILFGLVPGSGQSATLTSYDNLRLGRQLPSKKSVLISFERVTSNGRGAVFKLVAPAILHGSGICLPSASECKSLDLQVGRSEELEYVEANGSAVVYELKTVSIVKASAAAAGAKASASVVRAETGKP